MKKIHACISHKLKKTRLTYMIYKIADNIWF